MNIEERIQAAQTLLKPYAVPLAGTLGREHKQDPDPTRFPFQRDRDRIIHSPSFRRLKGKTQVFVSGIGDHYRTRLTHTMEVAQISRDIARTLQLNEDLAECIALAHDLGHPPFGHSGEDALNEWMQQHGSSFEHNQQSLRIVTVLDEHSSQYKGLNLNIEVLEGLHKHRTPHDQSTLSDAELRLASNQQRALSLEAQVVNIADEIAYTGHDCDDGVRAELFSMNELLRVPLVAESYEKAKSKGVKLRGAIIHSLVMDLYAETERQLASQNIQTLDDVYACHASPVRFSEAMRRDLDALRAFLWEHMYMHPSVLERTEQGKTIVVSLCDTLLQNPNDKVLALQIRHDEKLHESVKDYVAGMTDSYAVDTLSALTA